MNQTRPSDVHAMRNRLVERKSRARSIAGAVRGSLVGLSLMLAVSVFSAHAQPSKADVAASDIQRVIAAPIRPSDGSLIDRAMLERFYGIRAFHPAWSGSPAAERARAVAMGTLAAAPEHGLDADDYAVATRVERPWPASAGAAAESDVRLTDAVLRYMHDVRLGRTSPAAVYRDIALPMQAYDAVRALQEALAGGDLQRLLEELPPPGEQYAALKAALARYRALAAAGGWPQIPSGATFDAQTHDPRNALLRRRLAIEDPEISSTADPAQSDDLDRAIRRFQARNGLDVDGRVGLRTLAALNVSARARIEQLRVNLERWRWLPRSFEPLYVTVNVADARLAVIDGEKPLLTSRVVVGDRRHPTPIFRALATQVTVNPPWNVPPSIARAEILPRLRRDPGYLRAENMILLNGPPDDPHGLTVNWRALSPARFPYRIQQLPGPGNALGAVKLELPNRFDVYLHDTPAKALFARSDRALSHGCIRVEAISPLAAIALGGNPEGVAELREAMSVAPETRHLTLRRPLPIYVLYWTAVANADGTVGFRDDIYRRDERLLAVLDQLRPRASVPMASTGCPGQASG